MAAKGNRKRVRDDKKSEEESLENKTKTLSFRRNAFLIINEMVKLNAEHPTMLLNEILHSIFFLGKLNDPEFFPECIASNDDEVIMIEKLKALYPRPFDLYSSHLPKRCPFSCVLDMIVKVCGHKDDENEIINSLQGFISQLEPVEKKCLVSEPVEKKCLVSKRVEKKCLVSSTLCVSQSDIPKSDKYYGVSMSTSGSYPGKIMVAASCLSSWDSYVADAVMTYSPTNTKKPDFDGTIKLPQNIRCKAFHILTGIVKSPCRSCGDLFGLLPSESKTSDHGNCAEVESLSKLLKDVEDVRNQVRPTSETCTDENREKVKKCVLTELKRLLRVSKFKWDNDENFYDPSFTSVSEN